MAQQCDVERQPDPRNEYNLYSIICIDLDLLFA